MSIHDDWLKYFIPKNSFYEFLQNTTVSRHLTTDSTISKYKYKQISELDVHSGKWQKIFTDCQV